MIHNSINAIIASTTRRHGEQAFEYMQEGVRELYGDKTVLFIGYARPGGRTWKQYTDLITPTLSALGVNVLGIETFEDHKQAIQEAEAVFVGGGNTFKLVHTLYAQDVLDTLKQRVLDGMPYLGSSAGANITGPSMRTTNDMPVMYPPSFKTLGLIPYNINPHYQDPDPSSTHMGETREMRINEFHAFNDTTVIGLREGSYLRLQNGRLHLRGDLTARVFRKGQEPEEMEGDLTKL